MSPQLVDRTALDELGAVIGAEKLGRLVDRFVATVATAFEGGARTATEYGREAHTLISMSGMLGCGPLSRACRVLEQSAKDGTDLAAPLGDIRDLRDRTIAALKALRSEAGAPP